MVYFSCDSLLLYYYFRKNILKMFALIPKVQRSDVPLDRVSVFPLFSSVCSYAPSLFLLSRLLEADAFLAVLYCLPVTFFLCFLWQWKDSHCRFVLGATESIPPVHPFPNTAVLRLLPDSPAHHPSLVLGSAEVFLLVDPGVNLVSSLSFTV